TEYCIAAASSPLAPPNCSSNILPNAGSGTSTLTVYISFLTWWYMGPPGTPLSWRCARYRARSVPWHGRSSTRSRRSSRHSREPLPACRETVSTPRDRVLPSGSAGRDDVATALPRESKALAQSPGWQARRHHWLSPSRLLPSAGLARSSNTRGSPRRRGPDEAGPQWQPAAGRERGADRATTA